MTTAKFSMIVAAVVVLANVALVLSGSTAQLSCTVARMFNTHAVASTTQ